MGKTAGRQIFCSAQGRQSISLQRGALAAARLPAGQSDVWRVFRRRHGANLAVRSFGDHRGAGKLRQGARHASPAGPSRKVFRLGISEPSRCFAAFSSGGKASSAGSAQPQRPRANARRICSSSAPGHSILSTKRRRARSTDRRASARRSSLRYIDQYAVGIGDKMLA